MEAFIAQITMFGGNFAPRNWALCDGQLLPISSYSAVFSLVGTIYGGDGRTTFALPDMRGRVPMHPGNGPGLTGRRVGQRFGSEYNVLNVTQLPTHTHQASLSNGSGNVESKLMTGSGDVAGTYDGGYLSQANNSFQKNEGRVPIKGLDIKVNDITAEVNVTPTGGGQEINNIQPSLCVNFIFCLTGIFPSRS